MSIDKRVADQFKSLIAEAVVLAPYRPDEGHQNDCLGWLVAAEHLVALVCKNPINAYRLQTRLICATSNYEGWNANVGQLASVLKRLLGDVENGLISSIVNAASAETLDDLLDQAKEYHRRNQKEGAGILATAVYEDTIRRLARNNDVGEAGVKADQIISDLAKKDVITSIMAKRCRVAADVRNHALHAQWDKFTLADIDDVMRLTHELLTEHLAK